MINDKSFNIENIISDIFKETRLKISKDDPVLSIILMHEKILEHALTQLKNNNQIATERLSHDISSIRDAINALPDAIDEKTSELQHAAVALHDEFQESKGEIKGSLEEARINATEKLAESAKELQLNITKVAEKTTETIASIQHNNQQWHLTTSGSVSSSLPLWWHLANSSFWVIHRCSTSSWVPLSIQPKRVLKFRWGSPAFSPFGWAS